MVVAKSELRKYVKRNNISEHLFFVIVEFFTFGVNILSKIKITSLISLHKVLIESAISMHFFISVKILFGN